MDRASRGGKLPGVGPQSGTWVQSYSSASGGGGTRGVVDHVPTLSQVGKMEHIHSLPLG